MGQVDRTELVDVLETERQAEAARAEAKKERFAREAELVKKAQAGDMLALEAVLKSNAQRLYSVALGILKQPELAEDAVQETLIKAFRKLDTFNQDAAFSTWIYRICFNTCLDFKRKQKRDRSQTVTDHTLSADLYHGGHRADLKVMAPIGDQMKTPLERIQDGELNVQFESALGRLSEAHQTVIRLREVEGLSYEEIAEALDISKGTVMSRLFHARKKLAAILGPYLKEGGRDTRSDEGDLNE